MSMNLRGKDIEVIRAMWRARYGTDAPLRCKPTDAERNCECPGKPDGCNRGKCPRRKG